MPSPRYIQTQDPFSQTIRSFSEAFQPAYFERRESEREGDVLSQILAESKDDPEAALMRAMSSGLPDRSRTNIANTISAIQNIKQQKKQEAERKQALEGKKKSAFLAAKNIGLIDKDTPYASFDLDPETILKMEQERYKQEVKPPPSRKTTDPLTPEMLNLENKVVNDLKTDPQLKNMSPAEKENYALNQGLMPDRAKNIRTAAERQAESSPSAEFEKGLAKQEADRIGTFLEKTIGGRQNYDQTKARVDALYQMADNPNLPTPQLVAAAEYMGVPLSIIDGDEAEAQVFEKTSQDLLKGLPETFGNNRILKIEVENFLKTIPSLMNNPVGKKKLARKLILLNEMKLLAYNTTEEMLEKYGRNRDLDRQVIAAMQPKMDELVQEFTANSDFLRKKVAPNTKLNDFVIKKYLEISNDDPELAAKKAREDGYTW